MNPRICLKLVTAPLFYKLPMPSNSRKSNELAAEVADAADGRKGADDSELIGQAQSGQD